MNNRTIGATLLIIGTAIGGGMLALPVATAQAGFAKSTFLLIGAWLFMTIGSLLVLEVCLWLPESTNFSSMAKKTLGLPGQIVAWISYVLILYCVLCAYTAGGADLLQQLFAGMHLHPPRWINDCIYVAVLGSIVWHGMNIIDYTNRLLMFIKLASLVLLMFLIAPHTNPGKLVNGPSKALIGAMMVTALSFTFSIVVPSVRGYLKSNVKQIRLSIWIGSTIPLVCYIAWNYLTQSTINTTGPHGLLAMAKSGQVVGGLTTALSNIAHSTWLVTFAHLFSTICMFTTFLAASLSLSDFIADGLKLEKKGKQKPIIYGLTFLPVLAILFIDPNIFLKGLTFAGVFCVVIVMILPALMVWRGRYHQKIATGYRVFGGKPLLAIECLLGVSLIIINFWH
jgi:tyrosine-specific transport protein